MIHDLPMLLYRMGIKDHNGSNCLEKHLVIKWDWLWLCGSIAMGKGKRVSKKSAVQQSTAQLKFAEAQKPSTFRQQQRANILAGLRAMNAPAVI